MLSIFKKFYPQRGAAVIETALTIPIVIYLIFFLIELLRIKDIQSALDAIAEECSVQFMFTKSTNAGDASESSSGSATTGGITPSNFDTIIAKYKPKYISPEDITYYFTFFDTPKEMYENDKNIAVYWPESENSTSPQNDMVIEGTSEKSDSSGEETSKNDTSTGNKGQKKIMEVISNYKHPEKGLEDVTLNHRAFILTVVVRYRFTSAFVSKLFMGGSNTKSKDGFLIWSRGVGFCR